MKLKQRHYQRIALVFALWLGTISQVVAAVASVGYTIKTIAGTGEAGCSNQVELAKNAKIQGPRAIVLDKENQGFYLFERQNHIIRYFDQNGYLIPIAGTCGQSGYSPDGTLATQAKLYEPVNGKLYNGELYFTEFGNHRVRKIGSDRKIYTLAGNGESGFSGDGGQATSAQLIFPAAIEISHSEQRLYIADAQAHCIRVVDLSTGIIQTFMGTCGTAGYRRPAPPSQTPIYLDPTVVQFNSPRDIRFLSPQRENLEYLLINDTLNQEILLSHWIHRGLRPYYHNPPSGTKIFEAVGFESYAGGALVADATTHQILEVNTVDGNKILAGTGVGGYNGDQIDATSAQLNEPRDIKLGWNPYYEEIYVADTRNNRVRVLDPKPSANFKFLDDPAALITYYGRQPLKVRLSDNSRDFYGTVVNYQWISSAASHSPIEGEDERQVEFTFNDPGTYTIKLIVTDDNGGTGETTKTVEVIENIPPVSELSVTPTSGRTPLTVEAKVHAQDHEHDPITYAWQYYKKGSPSIPRSETTETVNFDFKEPGEYCIIVTVSDDRGGTSKSEKCVQVNANLPPTPLFKIEPTSGEAPLSVKASDQGSSDPEGDPMTYEWKYSKQGQTGFTSSGEVIDKEWIFEFKEAGTYRIVLVVRDNQGGESESQPQYVQVEAPGVSLVLAMEPKNTSTCGTFDVVIAVKAPNGQQFETVRAILNFNPQHLQVEKVKHGAVFDFTPKPTINNSGFIDLRASVMFNPNKPTGVVDLMTITFKPTNPSQQVSETLLTFDPVKSTVKWKSQELLKSAPDIKLTAVGGGGELIGIAKLRHLPNRVIDESKLGVCIPNPKIQTATNTNNQGKFKLDKALVPGNTYDIYISRTNTLQKMQSVSITACQANNIDFYLSSGDVAGPGDLIAPDNQIDSDDENAFVNAYGVIHSGDTPTRGDYDLDGQTTDADVEPNFYRSHFDLDKDGDIDEDDPTVFIDPPSGNFGEIGDSQGDCKKGEVWKGITSTKSIKSLIPRISKQFSLTSKEVKSIGSKGSFDVVIKADETQAINVITAYFNFDPESLQINAIKAGKNFDTVLAETYNNSTGQIAFRVMHLGKEKPQGTFNLMTIDFTLLKDKGEQTLTLDVDRTRILSRNGDLPNVQVQAIVQDNSKPLLIDLFTFSAVPQKEGLFLNWLTGAEINNAGFNVLRSEEKMTRYVQLNNNLIPTQGHSNGEGATYNFVDDTVTAGKIYYYKLQDIDFDGTSTLHGPITFITIRSPADNATLTSTAIPTFEWLSDTNQKNILEYFYDEEVYEVAVSGTTFTPSAEAWQAFAETAKGRTIFWRIVNNETVSEIQQFTIVDNTSDSF